MSSLLSQFFSDSSNRYEWIALIYLFTPATIRVCSPAVFIGLPFSYSNNGIFAGIPNHNKKAENQQRQRWIYDANQEKKTKSSIEEKPKGCQDDEPVRYIYLMSDLLLF